MFQTFQGDGNGYEQMKQHLQKRRNEYKQHECSNQTSTESDVEMLDIESDSETGKGGNIKFVTESPLSESKKSNRKHVKKLSVNHMNIKKNLVNSTKNSPFRSEKRDKYSIEK